MTSRSIAPGIQTNFLALTRVIRSGNASLVMCRHPNGTELPVICALNADCGSSARNGWSYSPFALLMCDAIRPLFIQLTPPATLYAGWNCAGPK